MRHFRFSLGLVVCLVGLLFTSGCGRDLEPLVSSEPGDRTALPEDAIVLNPADTARLEPPFALTQDATAATGRALVVKEGDESTGHTGRAVLTLDAPAAGTYSLWAHVRWNDDCGNSFGLALDGRPEFAAVQDTVYAAWHWVKVGRFELPAGPHQLTLAEREDGISLDQFILTRDASFVPSSAIRADASVSEPRRFADDFARSPGHGLKAWEQARGDWEIVFNFDPNRISNQYALVGRPPKDAAAAMILAKAPPWSGCRVAVSVFPLERTSSFGVFLAHPPDAKVPSLASLRDAGPTVGIQSSEGGAKLSLTGPGLAGAADVTDLIEPRQWHRIVIERWAWVLRVTIDDRLILENYDAAPTVGSVGLYADGTVVFDDFDIEEILWQADDGGEHKIPWNVPPGAEWFRPSDPEAPEALIGRSGAIAARGLGLPVQEVVLDEMPDADGRCAVLATGLESEAKHGVRAFRPALATHAKTKAVRLEPSEGEVALRRIAVRYGNATPDVFRIGPYDFSKNQIEDPSDYLDFTPEEYKAISQSPEADKLRREAKFRPVLNRGDADDSPWVIESGYWRLGRGVLHGRGRNAVLRHTQEVLGDFELRFRFRTPRPDAAFEIELYARPDSGARVAVLPQDASAQDSSGGVLRVHRPADGDWHDLLIHATHDRVSARIDGGPPASASLSKGDGGTLLLKLSSGAVQFDDIEFRVARHGPHNAFYAFDRREPDWWRRGETWMDHAGIACVPTSSWVSLIAPESDGMLWNKRPAGPDVIVAFEIGENTEWFGWNQAHSHTHHPFENVCIQLAPESDPSRGYRLVVNADERAATILYRNGKPVARVAQDGRFPLRYIGGHAPYTPRKARISLVKRGPLLRAIVDSREVLRFEDPDPIDTSRVAIGGYKTRINFSNIEIISLPASPPTQK